MEQISKVLLSLTVTIYLHRKNFNLLQIVLEKWCQVLAKVTENVKENCQILTTI